ncbi:MAG TPA: pentapeptide repeat-containing protein [Gaiellaceae bacterium]|jgi:hypothetical protein|nr:pentapeptide repeat-containing protein [Gaiellaceae bacterium]
MLLRESQEAVVAPYRRRGREEWVMIDDRPSPTEERKMALDRRVVGIVVAMLVAILAAGCGGSDGPESEVNGCAIQPATQCAGADLSSANLEGADLSSANLSGANLEGTNLSGANLSEANLTSAQIVETDLSDADLTGTNLTGATISGTNLEGATLCGTIKTDGTTDDTSCPPSTETTDTTSTDTTVTSLVVGEFICSSGASDAAVAVSWTTQNATAAEIGLDGQTVSESGPSGSTTLQIPCDGETHEVSVTPLSDSGPGEPQSQEVSSG